VPTFAIRDIGVGAANVALTVTSGRAPTADGEAAIGPASARDLHLGVGDSLHIGAAPNDIRIVGMALFPDEVHTSFDEGLWVVPSQLDAALPPSPDVSGFTGDRYVALHFPNGTDVAATIDQMSTDLGDAAFVSAASVPLELTNLRNVRTLPLLLAVFLAVLAIAAVSHVLVTTTRRRSHDFAVLRAIGMNRRGTRTVLNAQGTAIGAVGLLVGVPVGLVVGRVGWRYVAERVPLEEVPPFALLAVVLVVPLTVVIVNALAVWPGRRVARLRPGELLRTE
ncbi:MAG: putative transport system permease protein, partial [Acidimicrobiaceae bacterium]